MAGLAAVQFEAAMLILLGLLPTIVLGLTGKGEYKAERLQCVSMANFSGIIMIIPEVWNKPSAFEGVIFSLNSWVIMWGSAAIGYALIYVGPMIAAIVLQSLSQDRIKKINAQRQELVEVWGTDVLGDKDEGKVDFGPRPKRPL
jgi:cbb3-type cytochrome oxidase subunit 1